MGLGTPNALRFSGSRWLAKVSTVRPEILLPIVLALVFVAAFEGSHAWGDLYVLIGFGVVASN